jgi:subtilisin family serine protease
MNKCLFALVLSAVLAPLASASQRNELFRLPIQSHKNGVVPGYIVVKMAPETATAAATGKSSVNGVKYVSQIAGTGWTLWGFPTSISFDAVARSFRAQKNVIHVQPLNKIYPMLDTPNDLDWNVDETDETYVLNFGEQDPSFKRLWHLDDISAFNGWSAYPGTWYTAATKPSNKALIAIIDTGCDMNHPDFINAGGAGSNVTQGGQLVKGQSKQFELGVVKAHGSAEDHNGHGTHVAGLALAAGNNTGFGGHGVIGSGYMCKGMILRVFDNSGSGTDFDAAGAMYYAADHKAAVINLSLGTENFSQLFQDASTYAFQKGSLVVAAGNEDGNGGGDLGPIYPAGCSGVLGVSANGPNQYPATATYSGFGSYVDIAAPGGDIVQDTDYFMIQYVLSTSMRTHGDLEALSDQGVLYPPYTRNYAYLAGTSMASPIVAGAAGAYMSQKNYKQGLWRNLETYKAMQRSADGVIGAPYGGWEPYQGYGSLNMQSLLTGVTTRAAAVGSVEGIVYTNSTAISNVAVRAQKLVNGLPTGFTYSTTTNQHGYYRFDALPPASYQVRAAPNGQLKTKNVQIEVGCDTTGFDFWCGTYTGDTSAPEANAIKILSAKPVKVRLQHFAYDTETGIDQITYTIGTSPGGSDVLAETEIIPRANTVELKGVSLTPGNTYYLRGKYVNGNGDVATRSATFVATS